MHRWKLWIPGLGAAVAAVALLPSCNVGYLLSSGYYQAELLASRTPIDDVLADGKISAGEEQRLRLVGELKAYGKTLGLSSTDNYDTIALGWDRTIWNLSACDELSFEPVTWWFPVVGRVPYLGFFDEKQARSRQKGLEGDGYDVHVRTAGAYSTLGWFRDPVLPGMLRWSEPDLAEVVFHELAHATLWVPGSVNFNESFASFVGEQAARAWIVDRYGPDAKELADVDRKDRDWRRFEAQLHDLYKDLDKVYTDPALTDDEKRARKKELFGSMEARILASDIEDKSSYVASLKKSAWNNARLMQFRTYNSNEDWFKAIYERSDSRIDRFIARVDEITQDASDPFLALEQAANPVVVQNP